MSAMGQDVALVTADKNLAKFWCGLRPTNPRFFSGRSLTYDVDLPAYLFLDDTA